MVPSVVCPDCHAELDVHRETCPYCQAPLIESTRQGNTSAHPHSVLDRPWVIAVLMLHVGFLGIPLYWKTSYSVQTRLILCLASILYTVFAVGMIVAIGAWLIRVFQGG
jgi:predicted amidophosphoribosyltransferase